MTTFVSLDELSRYVGTDYRFSLKAALILESACQAVRDFLHQDIDYLANDEVRFLVLKREQILLRLPQMPVVEIVSVVEDDDDPLTIEDDYVLDGRSGLRRLGDFWPYDSTVTVTYSHGWATTLDDVDVLEGINRVPANVRQKALDLAAAAVTTSAGAAGTVESETIGSYSYSTTSDAAAGMVITEEDGLSIARYRPVGVA